MSNALIIVDYQYDFKPGGALAVPDGDKVRDFIITRAEDPSIDVVVMTRDWHPEDHVSFSENPQYVDKSWPPHCVQGTQGAEIDNVVSHHVRSLDKLWMIVDKGYDREKEAYSGFEGTVTLAANGNEMDFPLNAVLLHADVDRVEVVGLAADYCVRATADDAYMADFATTVLLEGTRPVNWVTGSQAILDLAKMGVSVR